VEVVMSNVVMFPLKCIANPTSGLDPHDNYTRFAEAGRQLAVAVLQLERLAGERALPAPTRLIDEGTRIAAEAMRLRLSSAQQEVAIAALTKRTLQLQASISEWVQQAGVLLTRE